MADREARLRRLAAMATELGRRRAEWTLKMREALLRGDGRAALEYARRLEGISTEE